MLVGRVGFHLSRFSASFVSHKGRLRLGVRYDSGLGLGKRIWGLSRERAEPPSIRPPSIVPAPAPFGVQGRVDA